MPTYWDAFCEKNWTHIIGAWSINTTLKKFYEFLEEKGQFGGEELREAFGLLTTLAPAMEMDAEHPMKMAHEIVEVVNKIKGEAAETALTQKPISFQAARAIMGTEFLENKELRNGYRDNIAMLLHDRGWVSNFNDRGMAAEAILTLIFGE